MLDLKDKTLHIRIAGVDAPEVTWNAPFVLVSNTVEILPPFSLHSLIHVSNSSLTLPQIV
jgi:hypothetical protein